MNNDFNRFTESGQSAQNETTGRERTQYTYGGYQGYTPPQRPKKEKRSLRPAAVIAICTALSLCVAVAGGFGGAYLSSRMSDSGGSSGGTVLYRTVALKDEDGNNDRGSNNRRLYDAVRIGGRRLRCHFIG